jgi:hypothetical protein
MQRIKSGADEEVFFKTLDQIIVETPQSVYGRLEKIMKNTIQMIS